MCTRVDSCRSGACVGVSPVVCAVPDQCHDVGVCNPASGVCGNPPKQDGVKCNDGNACTRVDACRGGACVGGDPVMCVPLNDCHLAGQCNAGTGICTNPVKANGSGCDDGDLCTQTDQCAQGRCVGRNPVVCRAVDQCHVAGKCDSTTGECGNPPKKDGVKCNDNSRCSSGDHCMEGICIGKTNVVCSVESQCHDLGICDPATGICSNPVKATSEPCDDGKYCTVSDYCEKGICLSGKERDCRGALKEPSCQDPYCNEEKKVCEALDKNEGGACWDDGEVCTSDICKAGVCVHPPLIDECGPGVCGPSPSGCRDCGGCPGGQICTDARKCIAFADFLEIKAGTFMMGSPKKEKGRESNGFDESQHKVRITIDYEIQTTEATQGQFFELMGYSPSTFNDCGANCPVESLSWHEAAAFANELSKKARLEQCFDCKGKAPGVLCRLKVQYGSPQQCKGYRLPTEAEWEYAARAGASTAFHSGEITELGCRMEPVLDQIGWYCGNAKSTIHPVQRKNPNAWGLYDMSGNVGEWVHDWSAEYPRKKLSKDPSGKQKGTGRLARGGSWKYYSRYARVANRRDFAPGTREPYLGFRLARTLEK